ncbi:glycosyltransferase [Corallincola holothuriorum]|uniref:Glycosyltransferase n=1 Tax=Corallincola holothuriorum TaxID=2282215 RepID=A0A368NHW3_9GAMM|nr:glycosyltransferase [Corallincola holothuriorum]RCU49463.1 glycosyltransferase [Corallincola holothuriorum]
MKVSVYITTCNRLELLKRALKSVQNQTYSDIEIIVADDGSSDGTKEYLNDIDDPRVKYLHHEKPLGACVGRNEAIKLSCGDYVTGMDDDDWFTEDRIEKFVQFWEQLEADEQKKVSGLYSDTIEYHPGGEELKRYRKNSCSYRSLRQRNGVGNQVFAPRNRFVDIGGFDPKMPAWQDWDCWLRMAQKFGDFVNCGHTTYLGDATHDLNRITAKNPDKIRKAHTLLCQKMGHMSFKERLLLNQKLVDYRQIIPKLLETIATLAVGDVRLFVSCVKRMLFARHQ